MLNFEFHLPTKLVYGKDEHKRIGELMKPFASKVLVHYGSERIKKSGIFEEVTESLKAAGIGFVSLGGVVANPRLPLVHEGIALAKAEGVDAVLAVGGGSVIDSAKAIAAGVLFDSDIWDAFQPIDPKPITRALPVAAILTLPAAGSETSNNAVISDDEKKLKYMITADAVRPVVSVLNPELFFSLPKEQIANGVADMMSHVFERYFTSTTHTDLTDALAEATLRTIMAKAPALTENPADYDTWAEIGLSGTVAHCNILGIGRMPDWGTHNLEHQLSAVYDVAHGAGLAVLTPSWMRYMYPRQKDIFLQFAVNVMGVSGGFRTKDEVILEAINKLSRFFATMGLPQSLQDMGIDETQLDFMARRAVGLQFGDQEIPIGLSFPMGYKDVLEILKMSLR
jgi:alcohol dehydrogenase YqhD (iron-dependent ADH family)